MYIHQILMHTLCMFVCKYYALSAFEYVRTCVHCVKLLYRIHDCASLNTQ